LSNPYNDFHQWFWIFSWILSKKSCADEIWYENCVQNLSFPLTVHLILLCLLCPFIRFSIPFYNDWSNTSSRSNTSCPKSNTITHLRPLRRHMATIHNPLPSWPELHTRSFLLRRRQITWQDRLWFFRQRRHNRLDKLFCNENRDRNHELCVDGVFGGSMEIIIFFELH